MDTVRITVKSAEKSSRLELFVRFIWGFIVGVVLWIIGFFAGIAWVIQWCYILITGKRHAGIQKFINNYTIASTNLTFYWALSTDERPPFIPEF